MKRNAIAHIIHLIRRTLFVNIHIYSGNNTSSQLYNQFASQLAFPSLFSQFSAENLAARTSFVSQRAPRDNELLYAAIRIIPREYTRNTYRTLVLEIRYMIRHAWPSSATLVIFMNATQARRDYLKQYLEKYANFSCHFAESCPIMLHFLFVRER